MNEKADFCYLDNKSRLRPKTGLAPVFFFERVMAE